MQDSLSKPYDTGSPGTYSVSIESGFGTSIGAFGSSGISLEARNRKHDRIDSPRISEKNAVRDTRHTEKL